MSVIEALVQSLPGRDRESEDGSGVESEPGAAGGSDSALFHCLQCDTVYVAMTKEVCSDCGTDVSRVPSTLETE